MKAAREGRAPRAAQGRPVLGLVTIGQTPRPDLEAVFARHAPEAVIRLRGALDGLDPGEIEALVDPAAEYPLLVRLANGTTAEVPRARLVPRVETAAQELAREGAGVVVVLCAGEFPPVRCAVPVVLPGRLLPAIVGALYAGRKVGIVTPLPGQIPSTRAKWEADGFVVEVVAASPVRHAELRPAALALAQAGVACVVLDCMGHDEAYREEFARLSGRPVLAAQGLVARLAGQLLASQCYLSRSPGSDQA